MGEWRAIILAAGRGSRMGAMTGSVPKCRVPLLGSPLLAWQMETLASAGISELALVTGYGSEHFGDFKGMRFHNPRWAETNMVRTLQQASPWLRERPCLVAYSDILYRPGHVRALMGAEADLAITADLAWRDLWCARFEDPLGDAETFRMDGQARLLDIGGKTRDLNDIQGQYMGLLRFTAQGWSWVEEELADLDEAQGDRLDMTGLLRRLLDRGRPIHVVAVRGGWCEVDSARDLALYERLAANSEGWIHDWRP